MYRYFSSGEKSYPIGTTKILDNQLQLVMIGRRTGLLLAGSDNAVHPVDLQLFQRIIVRLGGRPYGGSVKYSEPSDL